MFQQYILDVLLVWTFEWFVEINEALLWYVAINYYQGATMVTRDHQ